MESPARPAATEIGHLAKLGYCRGKAPNGVHFPEAGGACSLAWMRSS